MVIRSILPKKIFSVLTVLLLICLLGFLPNKDSTVDVLITSKTLSAGDMLDESSIAIRSIPQQYIPGNFIAALDMQQIIGRQLAHALGEHEYITWSTMSEANYTVANYLPKDHRLVVIQPKNLASLRSFLTTQHVLDILWQPMKDNGDTTILLFSSVKIVSFVDETEIALSLPVDQAMKLTHAMNKGEISIMVGSHHENRSDRKLMTRITTEQVLSGIRKHRPYTEVIGGSPQD